jgi:nucleotide-binding universal stress UspA family protein
MAIVTTAMTTPLLNWILPSRLIETAVAKRDARRFTVLVPVARPDSGGGLARMASLLAGKADQPGRIIALHLRRPLDRESFRLELNAPEGEDGLKPLLDRAGADGIVVEPLRFTSRDVPSDIARVARSQHADLILMGFHKPVFSRTILGGTVHRVLTGADCDVAVFVDRGMGQVKRILVPFHGSRHDRLAMDLAGRCARASGAEIVVLHVVANNDVHPKVADVVEKSYDDPKVRAKVTLKLVPTESSIDAVIDEAGKGYDLIVVGVDDEWGLESHLFGFRPERIADECGATLLLVRESEPEPTPDEPTATASA